MGNASGLPSGLLRFVGVVPCLQMGYAFVRKAVSLCLQGEHRSFLLADVAVLNSQFVEFQIAVLVFGMDLGQQEV